MVTDARKLWIDLIGMSGQVVDGRYLTDNIRTHVTDSLPQSVMAMLWDAQLDVYGCVKGSHAYKICRAY